MKLTLSCELDLTFGFDLPMRIDSLNLDKRSPIGPAATRRRFALNAKIKKQRQGAHFGVLAHVSTWARTQLLASDRLVIKLTRVAPGCLDTEDNLTGGLKAVRDGISDALHVNDRDPRLRWLYDQARDGRNYKVRVELSAMTRTGFTELLIAREERAP